MTEKQWVRLAELCGLAMDLYVPDSDEYWHIRWTQSYARTRSLSMQLKTKSKRKPLTTQPPGPSLPAMLAHPTQPGPTLMPPPHLWSLEPVVEPTPENQISHAHQDGTQQGQETETTEETPAPGEVRADSDPPNPEIPVEDGPGDGEQDPPAEAPPSGQEGDPEVPGLG